MENKATSKYGNFRHYALQVLLGLMILCLIFLAMWTTVVKTVFPGEKGVIFYRFAGGTDTTQVFDEGVHLKAPWDLFYVYNVREQIVNEEISVLSKDGLAITIELAIRFHPDKNKVGVIHRDLGRYYVETVLKPQVLSSARNVISEFRPEELYSTDRDSIETRITQDAKAEMKRLNIFLDEVMIKNIRLPEQLAREIEIKLQEEQKNLAYQYINQRELQEKERKIIEASGIKAFRDTAGISILKWRGLEVTENLAKSPNAKIVVVGTEKLPIILGHDNVSDQE